MKKIFSILITLSLFLSGGGCGKKGQLLPPLAKIPQTVEDIQAAQRADKILLTWNNPTSYTDGSPLPEIEEIEVWVLIRKRSSEESTEDISKEDFGQTAQLHLTIGKEGQAECLAEGEDSGSRMQCFYILSEKDFSDREYIFGFRAKGRKRHSAFSELVAVEPLVLPGPPRDPAVSVHRDRIELQWNPPEKNIDQSSLSRLMGYNIYRSEGEKKPVRLNTELVEQQTYADRDFDFGQKYTYYVRASGTQTAPFFESADSEAAEILAEDTFPPSPPKELIAVEARDFIALSWDPNTEKDTAGYRVWRRSEGEQAFQVRSPQVITDNAFTDRNVKKGQRYEYAVTALDQAGNESQKSKIISSVIRKGPQ